MSKGTFAKKATAPTSSRIISTFIKPLASCTTGTIFERKVNQA